MSKNRGAMKRGIQNFMQVFGSLLIAIFISGCMTAEQLQRERAEEIRQTRMQEESRCATFGFKRGTSDFSNCMLQLDIQKRNAEALRQATPPLTEKQCRAAGRFWTFMGCQ
jgi:hypothetical protein